MPELPITQTAPSSKVSLSCERCHATYRTENIEETQCPRCRKRVLKPGNASGVVNMVSTQVEEATPAGQVQQPNYRQEDVQGAVNDLMFKHGANLAERGDYPDLLAKVGLSKELVASVDDAITKAKKFLEQKVLEATEKPSDSKLVWALEPVDAVFNGATFHYWASQCGRYRVVRKDSPQHDRVVFTAEYRDHKGKFWHCEHAVEAIGAPKWVRDLNSAFNMVEKWHTEHKKVVRLTSNKELVMDKAAELGLIRKPSVMDQIGAPKPEKQVKEKKVKEPKQPNSPTEKKDSSGRKAPVRGVMCLGHSARRVVMWMGLNGWDMQKVKKTLATLGVVDLSESSVRTAWTDGKNPTYSKPAELTPEDIAKLEEASKETVTIVDNTETSTTNEEQNNV